MAKSVTVTNKKNETKPPANVDIDSAPLILNYGTLTEKISIFFIKDEKALYECLDSAFDDFS